MDFLCGVDISRIERGQDEKLYGVKIVLLLLNVGTQSNPYQAKLTSRMLAFSKEKNYSVESIGNLYVPESYVWSSTIGLSLNGE
jgi:hypothetical protein